jgi:hypothetical protein
MMVEATDLSRHGGSVSRLYLLLPAFFLVSCVTTSTHQFTQPNANWQTRSGQLLYRTPKTTVIGEAFVRFSSGGDFELTFSKGPVTLLTIHEDAQFAEVRGPLAGRGWAGTVNRAPQQLRGWLELRDALIHSQNQHQVRHASGSETFLFRF